MLATVSSGVAVVVALAGCGGASDQPTTAAAVPPVSDQVHDALTSALAHSRPERLPFAAVGACTGPAAGGPGSYRCQTTPKPRHGVSEVRVAVHADGTWATPPMQVTGVINGHQRPATSGLWGVLHLP